MKIKQMTATFGKLDKATLSLGDGLNILEAPNEGGKSTWSAFIRAMLYGIPTGQRDKAGFLAEKNRYLPWSGAPMEGSMTLEWKGREIILRRKAKGANPFGFFEAVDAATGEPIPELTADTAGPLLVGAEREVFERSAFVGQSALSVDGNPALEKRIAGLLSSGLEEISFSQVERQLKDWQNRRKHNKTGLIPKLEGEIEAESEHLARFSRARAQLEEGGRDLEALRRERQGLEADKAAYKALAERKKWLQYKSSYEEYQGAKQAYEQAAVLFQNLPGQDRLLAAQEELAYLQTLTGSLRIKKAETERVRQEEPAPAEEVGLSAGAGLACALTGIGLAVLCYFVAHTLLGPGYNMALTGFISCLVGIGGGGLLALLLKGRAGKKAREQADLLWKARLADLERDCDALDTEHQEKLGELLRFVHTFAPTATNEFGISAALSRALTGEDKLSPLKATLDGARKNLDMAKAALGPDPQPPQAATEPERPYQEVVARLAVLSDEIGRKERMVAAAQGELRTLGDPDEAEARLDQKREELERRKEEYEALGLALTALGDANQSMQARFSPALNKRAGELMGLLTGGKYDGLTLTREFQAAAQETGGVLPRNVLALSQGTADQLYLAVRLAVCDLTLPQKEAPALVLDDALCNFDQGRLELALNHLLERSREQQILLFTCHERESRYLAGTPGVTVTEV